MFHESLLFGCLIHEMMIWFTPSGFCFLRDCVPFSKCVNLWALMCSGSNAVTIYSVASWLGFCIRMTAWFKGGHI